MKRRLLLATLVGVMLTVLAAGAGAGSKQLQVGLVIQVGVTPSQRDVNGLVYRGFLRAVNELGVKGRVLQTSPQQGPSAALASLGRQKYDLIVAGLDVPPDLLDAAAQRFPDSSFLITNAPYESLGHKPKNVQGFVFRAEEGAYLAGYLAALMEKRRPGKDVISSVGGIKIPNVDSLILGYQAGARKADPGITLLSGYSQNFVDPVKCRAVALSQIARGSGVVFNVAGACGLGTLEVAKEKGVWAVGVDVDQSYLGPHILTSVVGRLDVAIFAQIQLLTRGTFRTGGDTVYDLANGGVGLGKISSQVPSSFLHELDGIREQIVAGKIKVPFVPGR